MATDKGIAIDRVGGLVLGEAVVGLGSRVGVHPGWVCRLYLEADL